ncbi:TPA: hypothetical protein DIV45_01390 [Patescibacteria group bacterium]|uniref:Squalene cyclase C-terminal domain-containing protein n=1 Tax=Candidatus Woykebacteria bacterium GWA1_44_8 TaxID=1802591 RepID=A0A1G1W4N5_9BACT|nr:MAG: hypothetical protein A2113_00430 [Candidatus Woykebacteria bacterium GWA1_44_8]HCR42002.1 hypothetical protein [Patescibacteria group bacterium]
MANLFITTGRKVKQLAQLAHLRVVWNEIKRPTQELSRPVLTVSDQLQLAIDWLLLAHVAVTQQGFSAKYTLATEWDRSYPETTGYIIPTLINYSLQTTYRNEDIKQVIIKSGEWLLSIQQPTGAFLNYEGDQAMVFDTGQVIFGLCAIYRTTQDIRYLLAAKRAGDWLLGEQEVDGAWIKHAYKQRPHVYYSYVSWALLELAHFDPDSGYRETAIKNLDWVVNQQQLNGWFNHFSFIPGPANLHTIGYTLQGLLAASEILGDEKYCKAAQLTADRLLILNQSKVLEGIYTNQWQSVGRSRCLTGLAQIGLVWQKLFSITQDKKYQQAAISVFSYLQTVQVVTGHNPDIKGALAGSVPLWGDYLPFAYPNWAPKFFIDLGLAVQNNLVVPSSIIALTELTQVFHQAQVRYWLNMGTLLGAVRGGALIKGDMDIDLGIVVDEVPKVLPLLAQLGKQGWRVDVTTFSIFFSKPTKGILIELMIYQHYQDQLWTPLVKILPRFNRLLQYADLIAERSLYKQYHQNIPWHHRLAYGLIPRWLDRPTRHGLFHLNAFFGQQHQAMAFPDKFIATLVPTCLYGQEFPAPSPAGEYLHHIYGSDWRTPNPYWRVDMVPAIDRTIFNTKDQAKYTLI